MHRFLCLFRENHLEIKKVEVSNLDLRLPPKLKNLIIITQPKRDFPYLKNNRQKSNLKSDTSERNSLTQIVNEVRTSS